MTFLNWVMLAGLAAVAIPILIHLLNRQKATIVDWGAMRFLMESLTSRSRRILIEEIILMALRCMAMALLVLALARPFLPSRSVIPWAIVLPAILSAAVCAGIAAAVWSSRKARWLLLTAAAVLFGGAIFASALEGYLQGRQWSLSGGERDVAILVDGSTSMTVPVDGQTNFKRAVDEARAVVQALRPADSVSVMLAGPVARPVIANPTSNREDIEDAFLKLQPTGGSMRIIDCLNAAAASLAQGHNPAKKIVVITDGQSVGWDVRNEARWKFLAAGLKELPVPPQIVCRTLTLPKAFRNAAIGDVRFSRKVVGTDRSVRIDVALKNTGTTVVEPLGLELLVDGVSVARQESAEMLPGAAENVRFDHRFDRPGLHVVTAKVLSEDEMPADNTAVRAMNVIDKLPVLIVEGDQSVRPLDGAASFIEIALTPVEEEEAAAAAAPKPAPKPDAKDAKKESKDGGPVESDLGRLVAPTIINAPEIQSVADFRPYSLVVLANVPRLPAAVAANLVKFVQNGGGLLIVTGDKTLPEFYNAWTSEGGTPFIPATLGKRQSLADAPAHFGLKTFSHPALQLMADPSQSDAERGVITSYWTLQTDPKDQAVRVGGLFDTGDPVIAERRVGKGYVLMTAVSLDRRESNLPSLKCFVPLVHELAYHLTAPTIGQMNVSPGSEFVLELASKTPLPAAKDSKREKPLAGEVVEVITPTDRRTTATVAGTDAGMRITFTGTYEPGLYRMVLPARAAGQYVVPASPKGGLPFVVFDDAEESRLAALTSADYETVAQNVPLVRFETTAEMAAAVADTVPGEELWKYLALSLLVILLAEIGLTRWIAMQRRMHMVETVSFGPSTVDVRTFRDRARALLAGNPEPESVSKS